MLKMLFLIAVKSAFFVFLIYCKEIIVVLRLLIIIIFPDEAALFAVFRNSIATKLFKVMLGFNIKNKNATTNVDRTRPTCKVNIRLFNGEVVSEDFNLNQTLQDVINFVRRKSGSNNFSRLDGFPPRPLTDYKKTIQELHLEGSLLTQRIS